MTKKFSLIAILCISLVAIWGTQASAWYVPAPPGISGWGCCSYAEITTRIAGGGPLDKNTGAIADDQTSLFVSIYIKEGYIVMFNPNKSRKNQYKKVTVGIGGHVPVLARSPLYGTLPADNGSGYDVYVKVPVDVDQCINGGTDHVTGEDIYFQLCADPPDYPTGTVPGYLTQQEDDEARFLFYWHIIRPEEGAPPLTAAEVAEQYFDITGGWSVEMLRIVLAEVYAYLDGKWAQGNPSPVVNIMTNENYRAYNWADDNDPWVEGRIIPDIYWVIRGQGEPFAFYEHVEAFGGTARELRPQKAVLSNDVDLEGDPLQVIAVGPAEDNTDIANVGVPTPTAGGGTITLDANGTYTYTAPSDPPVVHDYVWYKNGEKYGPNESNPTVMHFQNIY